MNILFYLVSVQIGGVRKVSEILSDGFQAKGHKVVWLIKDRFYKDDRDFPVGRKCLYLPSNNLMDNENINYYHEIVKSLRINVIINQDGLFEGVKLIDSLQDKKVIRISVLHSNPILNLRWLFKDALFLRNDTFNEKLRRIARIILFPRTKKIVLNSILNQFSHLENSDAHINVLSQTYIDVIHNFNKSINNISAIPNPNTYTTISECPKEKIVLFVGRLDNRSKKIQDLLNIWKHIQPTVEGWKLIIVGEGRDENNLKKQAENLNNIEFVGYQDPKPFYEKASILCMTSLFEGFPMTLTEAMQHGCVPIAYDSFPALKDIINNNIDGIIVKPFDNKAYAIHLRSLINNDSLRNQLSKAAKNNIARFDATLIVDMWLQLFKKLIYN